MKKSFIVVAALAITFSACGPATTVERTPEDAAKVQEYNSTMGKKDVVDPKHGKESAVWYGAVLGTNGTNANGIAFVHRFEDGAAVFTINLNILQAGAGEYYSVSLKSASGTEKAMGKLASLVGDARHSLTFDTSENLDGFTTVTVTKHASSGQSQLVAEGTLKLSPQ